MTAPPNDPVLDELRELSDASRARWAAERPAAPPEPPIVVPARLPSIRRPHWCALCGEEAPPGATYCLPCQPKAIEEAKRARMHDALQSIPEAHRGSRLSSRGLRKLVGDEALERAAAGVDRPMALFTGPAGAGKTSLACAMARALVDRALAPDADGAAVERAAGLRFVAAFELAYARADAALGQEPPSLRAWKRASLLIIDDLGAEPRAHNSPVGELIHHRHAHTLPTIVTSGFDPAALGERYGAGVERRLCERALVLALGRRSP